VTLPNFHGKEGVDGSSPSEGSAKAPEIGWFSIRSTCSASNVRWVWSRLWSFDAREADHGGWIAPRGVELWSDVPMCRGNKIAELDARKLLAPLDVGDQLPWHLGRDGSATLVDGQ
jgi:hypothetical protein